MLKSVILSLFLSNSLSLNSNLNEDEIKLNNLILKIKENPENFIKELSESEFAAFAPLFNTTNLANKKISKTTYGEGLPLVFLHGMGDSCFNNGMSSLTKDAGDYKGVYSVCIPTGETRLEDTLNGIHFLLLFIDLFIYLFLISFNQSIIN